MLLQGERVSLRPVESADISYIRAWRSNPEITRFWITQHVPTRDGLERQLQCKRELGDISLLILDEVGIPIGYTDLFGIDREHRHAELSLMIGDSTRQGMGYGREALEVLLSFAFSPVEDHGAGLHKVSLCVVEMNHAARTLYRSCGFREDGRLREDFYRDGQWHDQILMSVLEDEFGSQSRA